MLSTILSALFIALASYTFRKFTTRISPNIPYAGGESLLARLKVPVEYGIDPAGFLAKQRVKLGNIFCVDLFLVKIVFVLGAEGNKVVFRASEDELSFWDAIRWSFGPKMSEGIDFPGWINSSMKTVKTGLLSPERLTAYKLEVETAHIADEYFEKWSKEDSILLFKSMSNMILSHLFIIMLGVDFYQKHGEELIPYIRYFERDLQHPLLRVLPDAFWEMSSPGRRLFNSYARFDELLGIEAREIWANPEKHRGRSDYFYLICTTHGAQFSPVYGNHLLTMLFGGHANAAMTLPWMFLHARRKPGAIDRWRAEVALGIEAKKPFLDACLRETGRLYTNLTVLRRARTEVRVDGCTIKPGTMVACSPVASQRDPAVFKDPLMWKPERFLEEGAYAEWFQKLQFVQFGSGQHACPGEKLLRVMLDSILTTWLEKYDIQVLGGLREGQIGIDGVGAEGDWTRDNFGTPFVRGEDIRVKVTRRVAN